LDEEVVELERKYSLFLKSNPNPMKKSTPRSRCHRNSKQKESEQNRVLNAESMTL